MVSSHENPMVNDTRYIEAVNSDIPKPNFFNGKKIAEQLIEEREKLLSLANEFHLFTAAGILNSLNDGYRIQAEVEKEIAQRHQYLASLQQEIQVIEEAVEFERLGLYDFNHPAISSVELADDLKKVRATIKSFISKKTAAKGSPNFRFNNSEAQGRKFSDDMIKLMLRAYNAEAENAVKSVKSDRSEAATNRLNKCKEQVERLGKMIDLSINPQFHKARLKEIELAYKYHTIVRVEKELEREEKERIREEKKVEAELKRKQENLLKEMRQREVAIEQLKASFLTNPDTVSPENKEKLAKLEEELEKIDHDIKTTNERAANLKAGYVYVISNVGSFGEGRIKIGMTRRIDPMERVKELSSAAVPFVFDVHLIHYSNNALDIEKQLHQMFAHRRVNMVNKRKEHFYATPEEVKEAIMKLDGTITTFTELPEAEGYKESLVIREKLNNSNSNKR